MWGSSLSISVLYRYLIIKSNSDPHPHFLLPCACLPNINTNLIGDDVSHCKMVLWIGSCVASSAGSSSRLQADISFESLLALARKSLVWEYDSQAIQLICQSICFTSVWPGTLTETIKHTCYPHPMRVQTLVRNPAASLHTGRRSIFLNRVMLQRVQTTCLWMQTMCSTVFLATQAAPRIAIVISALQKSIHNIQIILSFQDQGL